MRNNTKVRLHLTKQLFESLTKQVVAESKGKHFGAGMEEVKGHKAPKKGHMREMETNVAETPGEEKLVTLTLREDYMGGDNLSIEVGNWVMENWPKIADALASTSKSPTQKAIDLGSTIIALASVGTVGVAASVAVAKDSILDAANKLKNKIKGMFGGKTAIPEGDEDPELEALIAKMPKEVLAKIAASK